MPEFVPTLVAGVVIMLLLWGVTHMPSFSGTTGAFVSASPEAKAGKSILIYDTTIFNSVQTLAETEGTITKESGLAIPFKGGDWDGGLLEFQVEKQGSGQLIFTLNGQQLWAGEDPKGKISVEFDKSLLQDSNFLEIKTTDWPWSDPSWKVKATVYGERIQGIKTNFLAPKTYRAAKLLTEIRSEGPLTIKVNGKEIFSGIPDESMELTLEKSQLQEMNSLEIVPQSRSRHGIDWVTIEFEK